MQRPGSHRMLSALDTSRLCSPATTGACSPYHVLSASTKTSPRPSKTHRAPREGRHPPSADPQFKNRGPGPGSAGMRCGREGAPTWDPKKMGEGRTCNTPDVVGASGGNRVTVASSAPTTPERSCRPPLPPRRAPALGPSLPGLHVPAELSVQRRGRLGSILGNATPV